MKILITGATHGLGRNAAEYLNQQHIDFRATGRDPVQGKMLTQLGIEFIAQDLIELNEKSAALLLKDIDVVWHCAALSSPWGQYQHFYQVNVEATEKLARYAAKSGVKAFIHISTPSIYFDYQHHLNIGEHYRAERFANYYAYTKMQAENKLNQLVRQYNHTTFLFLRPRAIFGPYDRVLLPRIFNLLKTHNGMLPLPRGGEVLMDITYVKNVVHAMLLATERALLNPKLVNGQAYNITNQTPIKLRILLDLFLKQQLNIPYEIKQINYSVTKLLAHSLDFWGNLTNKEPLITPYSIGTLNFDMTLDNAKAQRELNYYPQHSLINGIHETAQWFSDLWQK